jgi:predicted HAD superfamily phosphohydrolase YqeG
MSNKLRPLYMFNSVAHIDVPGLIRRHPGLRGITFDIDRFYTEHMSMEIPPEHAEKAEEIALAGLDLGFISNAHSEAKSERVHYIGRSVSSLIGKRVVVVSSFEVPGRWQRKPYPPIFRLAAERLGLPASGIIHGGDQIGRDVIGPNSAGYMGAILVPPYGPAGGESSGVRYIQRPIERTARFFMGLPHSDINFPADYRNHNLDQD